MSDVTNEEKSSDYKDFSVNSEENDGENKNVPENEKNTLIQTIILIIKSIIGIGIMDLPYVFKIVGIYYGISLFIFSCIITVLSVVFLIRVKDITQRYGYNVYAKFSLGKLGIIIIKSTIIFGTFFDCIIFLKILSGITKIFVTLFLEKNDSIFFKEYFYAMIIFLFLLPLMFKNDISALARASSIGVFNIFIFIISLIIVFLIKYFKEINPSKKITFKKEMLYFNKDSNLNYIFYATQSLLLSFNFQTNFFPLYLSLKQRKSNKIILATIISLIITIIIYILTSILGYLMYGNNLNDIIIIYFGEDINYYLNKNKVIVIFLLISEFTLFLSASLSMPIFFFSLKNNLLNLIKSLIKYNFNKNSNNKSIELIDIKEEDLNKKILEKNVKKFDINKYKHFLTFLIYFSILIFAIFFNKILVIEGIVGATYNNILVIIAPAYFLIKLDKKNKFPFLKFIAKIILIIGFLVLIIFFYLQFKFYISN